eukprot:CAMPEP_0119351416 /NCGR_PEP_ID=MMETSP1334-20130426/676_1 /TAXON_ID=127549 /ORGANISM="Calcidiscus leptoporus, Strain RCC1130" /LENGTH=483 /DNA_ID=CAMNT_0007364201 /DNA_START=149 /DNA_END=1600 /DNA_ORIENTATION=+
MKPGATATWYGKDGGVLGAAYVGMVCPSNITVHGMPPLVRYFSCGNSGKGTRLLTRTEAPPLPDGMDISRDSGDFNTANMYMFDSSHLKLINTNVASPGAIFGHLNLFVYVSEPDPHGIHFGNKNTTALSASFIQSKTFWKSVAAADDCGTDTTRFNCTNACNPALDPDGWGSLYEPLKAACPAFPECTYGPTSPPSPPLSPSPSPPPLKVVTCGGTNKKCNSKRFSFDAADGLIRLDCIGKDGCNSVHFECEEPSLCSVTCADGEPACNSLTVTRGVAVTCSAGAACNSVKPHGSINPSECVHQVFETVTLTETSTTIFDTSEDVLIDHLNMPSDADPKVLAKWKALAASDSCGSELETNSYALAHVQAATSALERCSVSTTVATATYKGSVNFFTKARLHYVNVQSGASVDIAVGSSTPKVKHFSCAANGALEASLRNEAEAIPGQPEGYSGRVHPHMGKEVKTQTGDAALKFLHEHAAGP